MVMAMAATARATTRCECWSQRLLCPMWVLSVGKKRQQQQQRQLAVSRVTCEVCGPQTEPSRGRYCVFSLAFMESESRRLCNTLTCHTCHTRTHTNCMLKASESMLRLDNNCYGNKASQNLLISLILLDWLPSLRCNSECRTEAQKTMSKLIFILEIICCLFACTCVCVAKQQHLCVCVQWLSSFQFYST